MSTGEREVRLVATASDLATVLQAGNDLHVHFEESLRRVRRSAPADGDLTCPYPGLAAFGAEQSRWFFGRDAVTADVLLRLDESLRDGRPLALVGPSGAGKSSVLNAGVLPALAQGLLAADGSRSWPRLVLTPTAHPLRSLAAAAGKAPAGEPAELWAAVTRDGPVVVVVDQLEELFTLCPDDSAERGAFVDLLAALPRGNLLVFGMRSDFYTQCAGHPWLRRVLQDNQILLGPMSEAELRQAILLPLRELDDRVEMEPGLVELLLRDLGMADSADEYQAGRLPLLAHALRACWQQRHGHQLTVAGYRATGGIRHAVAATAERVYQRLDDEQSRVARSVFLRLVRIGVETDDTRRRLSRTELAAVGGGKDGETVVDAFVRSRLLTPRDDAVEITHEVLLHAWPRLRAWIDADRTGRLTQQQLAETAIEWRRADREPGMLYRGLRLDAAVEWQAGHQHEITALEREFVAASADAAARRSRRLRLTVGLLATLLVLATVAGVLAADQWGEARHQASVNLSRQIALESADVREVDADLAILLAAEAVHRSPTREARASAVAAENQHLLARLDGHRGAVAGTAYAPDGRTAATVGAEDVLLWDLDRRTPVAHLPQPGGASAAVFTRDGRSLVTAGLDGNLYVWDTDTRRFTTMAGHRGPVTALALSRDGKLLASAGRDGTVRLWDLPARTGRGGTAAAAPLNAVALSPDGRQVAAGGDRADLRLWDTTTRREVARLRRKPAEGNCGTERAYAVTAVSFSPDGRRLVSGDGESCLLTVWDLRSRTSATTVSGHTWDVHLVSFSPDGSQVASTSRDGTLRLWNSATWAQLERRTGHTGPVLGLAWAPGGRELITGGDDRTIRLWRTPALTGHADGVNGLGWSPDGRLLATAGNEGTARIWDAAAGRTVAVLSGHTAGLGEVDFSPRGDILVTAGLDGTARLWDARTYAARATLRTGNTDWVYSAFSPDGRLLATAGPDRSTLVWDVDTRRVRYRITAHEGGVNRAVFSPDGRLLATGGVDDTVGLFDAATGRRVRVIAGPIGSVYGIVFTPDGKQIVSTGGDRYLRVWETATGRPLATLRGHRGLVEALAISPDGRRLASGDVLDEVITWDLASRTPLTKFDFRHTGTVSSVAFSPDGMTLASGSRDASVRLWRTDFDAGALDRRLCAVMNRDLTTDEWRQYLSGQRYERTCGR